MRHGKIDVNQPEIVKSLRKMGCLVWITSDLGKGAPDLVVGVGKTLKMVEVKDGGKPLSARKLTPDEAIFHNLWKDHILILNSVEEAIEWVNMIRK